MESLWSSWTALQSANSWLNRISNNISNEGTVGYAQQTGSFADTLTAAMMPSAAGQAQAGRYTVPPGYAGQGVEVTGVENDFAQMPLQQTGQATDLAIQGPGFFVIGTPSGVEYTKAGNFIWSQQANGSFELSTPQGNPVLDTHGKPIVQSSKGNLTVGQNGQVSFGSSSSTQTIAIAEVSNPNQNMSLAGANAYRAQASAGIHVINGSTSTANQGSSTIKQGYLAMSNVNLTKAMTDMIQAQEMVDLNSRAESTTGQMMKVSSNLDSASA